MSKKKEFWENKPQVCPPHSEVKEAPKVKPPKPKTPPKPKKA